MELDYAFLAERASRLDDGRLVVATLQMVFKAPGVYRLHLVVDDKELKAIPLIVHSKMAGQTEAKHDENAVSHGH